MFIHFQSSEKVAVSECLPFYSQASTISTMASAQNAMLILQTKY